MLVYAELILCGHSLGAGVATLLALVSNFPSKSASCRFENVSDVGRSNHLSDCSFKWTPRQLPGVRLCHCSAVRSFPVMTLIR